MSSVSSASLTLSDPFATQPVPAQIIMLERYVVVSTIIYSVNILKIVY